MSSNQPESSSTNNNQLRSDLIAMLRCPVTRSPLHQEGDWLIADVGGLAYPVRDGIPVMLAEEAKLPAGVASIDELRKRFAPQTVR